jgi:hypothetical protein
MKRTLIAVFDNRGDAQSALDELVSSGFSRNQIRLSEGDVTGASAAEPAQGGGSIVDSIKHFLGSMFGTDDSEYVQKYSDAVTRGHQVLTLTADDEPEVERAADIVERWGPVDIDEKYAGWRGDAAGAPIPMGMGTQQQSASIGQQSTQGSYGSASGTSSDWSSGSGSGSVSGAGSVQGGSQGAQQSSVQQGAQQGSQQFSSSAGSATSIPVSQRIGVRVFQHMVEPPVGADFMAEEDEMYYRSHYNSNYAGEGESYDDYAPAYRYGSKMASGETYRGKPWKDIEPALRSDWENNYPGSVWSKFKAAVRHGWERMTH